MGVDASIPLQVQPLKVPDPLQSYARLASIQNAQTQNRLADLQGQAAQVKLDENAAYKSALADPTNYDDKGNISTEGMQNILKVAPTEGRALYQLQRQNRLTDAQIGYYGARTQKDTVETQQAQHQALIKSTLDGLRQAKGGDLPGALTTFNQGLPKEQQATKLEYITDDKGNPVGLRAYLPDGTTHETPNMDSAIDQYLNISAKPDTIITTNAANDRADKQNAVTIRGQDVHAKSAKEVATIRANTPHYEVVQPASGPAIAVNTRNPNEVQTVNDPQGNPITKQGPVGPAVLDAKITAAKTFLQQHPRTIPDPNNPGKMKLNPEVFTIQGYDSMERLANTPYVGKTGSNTDNVPNPIQQAPQSAIDYLKRNPKLAPQFRQKYGYLPK